jgi:hypothetical protein
MRVLLVLHISDYRINEIIDSWYDRSEWTLIRDECRRTVAVMEEKETKGMGMVLSTTTTSNRSRSRSSSMANDDFCPRGLESRTQEGFRRKLQSRMAGWDAVLKEQEEQRIGRVGVSSSDASQRMATLYNTLVSPCVMVAQQLALLDEGAVSNNNDY